jgi:hypothetical protein
MHRAPFLIAALAAGLPSLSIAACEAQSGPATTALVELYTSEGCSSCPPADRELAELSLGRSVVPLALHVGYWDDLGWQDPFAKDVFARRQDWLVGLGGGRTVYTPQFFVGGTDARPSAVSERIRAINAQPPQASIVLNAHTEGSDILVINASARSAVDDAALYLVVAENGLSSQVRSGENGGRRLRHDHVVRAWVGPLRLRGGSLALKRRIPLDESWQRARLEVGAFVQDQQTGRVLQAVGAGRCVGW